MAFQCSTPCHDCDENCGCEYLQSNMKSWNSITWTPMLRDLIGVVRNSEFQDLRDEVWAYFKRLARIEKRNALAVAQ